MNPALTRSDRRAKRKEMKYGWLNNLSRSWILLAGLSVFLLILPAELKLDGKLAIITFMVATYCWVATPVPPAIVAIGSVLFLTMTGAADQELLYSSLSSDVIWLMIGAFIVGAAMQSTGLASRLVTLLLSKANSVSGLFFLLTIVIQLLTFFIPSTSGRASVMLPIYRDLSNVMKNRKVQKGLSILIPVIILIATSATLIGASSHLIANDYLEKFGHERISFLTWMVWGVPFVLIAGFLTCGVIQYMFLDAETRRKVIPKMEDREGKKINLSDKEKVVLSVFSLMVVLWMTEKLHGIEIATVIMEGALILVLPKLGVLDWKKGMEAVSWSLILFVGAAVSLGEALIKTGAAEWIMDSLLIVTEGVLFQAEFITLLLMSVISLTSHLYITSHTMRVVILVPPLLSMAVTENINVISFVFLLIVGMNYCITFPVSSKALLIFSGEKGGFEAVELQKLSKVLSVIYIALMILFYFTYWRWTGLTL
ncbi:SLC13 family permease [Pseudalkalibacillus sp. A8]|uniref:SLC13 family permease n=1 Tax=Pseudalkalibacillus sp. A8 TaxID=3382641 RepID=UPI0038B59D9C